MGWAWFLAGVLLVGLLFLGWLKVLMWVFYPREEDGMRVCKRCGKLTTIPEKRNICDHCLKHPHATAIPPKG